ncbi:thermonuclease family protein (plasmid) [Brevundimonas staleyi]|uniref:Thermonuclease family protein n=1 Tax=Brevundimonas staleyi TaxID=74326 RepID=A0ABW0FPV5_9CAUL
MFLIAVLVAVSAGCAPAEPSIQGRASVIDGDTLEIHGRRIRLWGVDAPESRQTCEADGQSYRCGAAAANLLDARLRDQVVSCFEEDIDRYDRMVARCEVRGEDLGGWLVRQGLAVRYARYAGDAYLAEEAAARHDKAGVWAGAFDPPEDWRRARRADP